MEDDERSAVEDIRDWLDRPGKGAVWTTAVTSSEKQITKYLAPGTVQDLFIHYQSTRQLFGSVAVSYLDLLREKTDRMMREVLGLTSDQFWVMTDKLLEVNRC